MSPGQETQVQHLAAFVVQASFQKLSEAAKQAIKIHLLDSLACAVGGLGAEPIAMLRTQTKDFGGRPLATLIGGGKTAPDRAAFLNGALLRQLDLMDVYRGSGTVCHPSDSISAVLAAAEYAQATGRELMTAIAVAYQVQCRLCDVAPVHERGFASTTLGAYAIASGVAKALALDDQRTANALALAGATYNTLQVTDLGAPSHWKRLAAANVAFGATHAAFLAMRGITGPHEVIEGRAGFMEAVAGRFAIDWANENLERVTRTDIRRFEVDVYAQSALEAVLELRAEHGIVAADVVSVTVDILAEEPNSSLASLVAVALLDGQVVAKQVHPSRLAREDVVALSRRVLVRHDQEAGRQLADSLPCRVTVLRSDGTTLAREKRDYEGCHTRPLSFEKTADKLQSLCPSGMDSKLVRQLVETVAHLDELRVTELTKLFERLPAANP